MPQYQALSRARHASKRWTGPRNYAFAAADAVVPLVAQEVPRAALHLPVGFVQQGDVFVPVAVLGIQPGQNLFVAPDGRWVGGYTPAAYRGYPFQLADTPDGRRVLVVDEGSGLIGEAEGQPFFDADGEASGPVKAVLDFLTKVRANRDVTARICRVLAEHELIEPWPIVLQTDGGERRIIGLHRISEVRLNGLDGGALKALQQAGALALAYCQRLSMQHLGTLGTLARARLQAAKRSEPPAPAGELDLEFLNQGGTLSFGNLH